MDIGEGSRVLVGVDKGRADPILGLFIKLVGSRIC